RDRIGDVPARAHQRRGMRHEVVEVQHVALRQPAGVLAIDARVVSRQLVRLHPVPAEPVQQGTPLLEWHVQPAQDDLLVQLVGPAPGPATTRRGPRGASMARRCWGRGSNSMPGNLGFRLLKQPFPRYRRLTGKPPTRVLMLAGLLVLAAVTLASQGADPQRPDPPPPTSLAATRAAQPPVIDGRDDDAVWREAQPIT